jgi:hypothetical protein
MIRSLSFPRSTRHASARLLFGAVLVASAWQPARASYPISFGGAASDEVRVVKTAPNGDIFVAGQYRGSIELSVNGQTETLTSRGGQDVFVLRMNAAGQVLWARSAGGVNSDDTLNDLALDVGNNVYITGEFYARASFGSSDLQTVDGQFDDTDGYLAKLTPTGNWEWARGFGSHQNDTAVSLVNLAGTGGAPPTPESIVVAGSFSATAYFRQAPSSADDKSVVGLGTPGSRDLYAARIAADGKWLWAIGRGASATGNDTVQHLAKDATGRIWMVGREASSRKNVFSSPLQSEADLYNNWAEETPPGLYNSIFYTPGVDFSYSADSFFTDIGLRFHGAQIIGSTFELQSYAMSQVDTQQAKLTVSVDVQRGAQSSFFFWTGSDQPDAGDDLYLEYYASGTWVVLERFAGGGTPAERFYRRGAQAYVITNPAAMNSDFKLRWRYVQAPNGANFFQDYIVWPGTFSFQPVPYPDAWHVRNVSVEAEGAPRPFLLSIGNELTSPQLNPTNPLPEQFEINDITMSSVAGGTYLLLNGTRLGDVTFSPCASIAGAGATVVSLNVTSGSPTCHSARGSIGGEGRGITTDTAGNVYVTGAFKDTVNFFAGPDGTLTSNGGFDPYIGRLNFDPLAGMVWTWVTGGNRFDADGLPARSGGSDDDFGFTITTGGAGGNLFVGGRFRDEVRFGEADALESQGDEDGFVVTLGRDGRYPREESWTVGLPITPPPGAELDDLTFQPDFRIAGQPFEAIQQKIFAWVKPQNSPKAQLIPLQPVSGIEVRWRVNNEPIQSDARLSSFGRNVFPDTPCGDTESSDCYQMHVVGAPVAAEPPSGEFKVLELINPASGSSSATYSAGRFVATRSGYSVLVYVNGPTLDQTLYPTVVEVVRTLPYDGLPPSHFVDNVPAEIGKRIFDPYHNEPGVTGFVVNELAYYDGNGPNAAYNRTARTGEIIPVNRYSSGRALDQGRELVVAWYRNKSKGVFWPDRAVRYQPYWPIDPLRIVIASEQGSEMLGQTRLNPAQFPSLSLYVQNDPELPGYNPNDEHAIMAPSSLGSGFEAAFALRADFGSRLAGDAAAASDPYVLLRYFDAATQQRKFLVYSVAATGAGFNQFRYTGVAGTTVSPPYPMRLLPGCAESFVEGQAVGEQPPPPFFQDYKNQLWAKSAGSRAVQYFYPAQPGFFSDLDRNDVNEIIVDTCMPWLARLPVAEGGTASPTDPIKVYYEINWPEESPLLVSGETLLQPKRGLPDIYNQAAVEVVYDAIQDEQEDPEPSDTLAQLLDPLNPRFVALSAIPSSIASNLETNGQISISGSSDGVIKLPVSIANRISFDPINRRLSVVGEFDDTIAGEPFLLLNVLSKRDRIALKRIDGGDGSEQGAFTGTCAAVGCSWDQAVEALFRKSRNPQGISRICTASTVNPQTRVRTCNAGADRAVTVDDVLIGYQDENNDYILEPYQASGVNAALSAGLSSGNGYLTLAFNNDPSLNPLPVSLQVIQVGCLVSPPPPATAVINSTYQGQINVISPEDIFDEQVVLRHGGDFGGNPDALEFEWYYHPDIDGNPPMPLPDPSTGQLNGWIKYPTGDAQGAVEISIAGANIQTLSDNWYVARYRGLPACQNQTRWSLWAGQPGATPINERAQLAAGWVKRVIGRLNPFEARVQDFGAAETNNYASMLIQLGERYSGPIALNNDPDNLNSIGLIEAYTTVMLRALSLSADATPPIDYGPANSAILLVASRLVDFYTLLGNEAYADAQDPTIAITTSAGNFSLSPSIFNFQNQLDSLLSEELVLLRGRDTANGPVAAAPVYNRLFWNFTTGDGEVAYALSYDVSDQNFNGVINEFDARIMFPQGHGDAWGHYLTGTKIYYNLLRHPFFSWDPRPEAVQVAGVPLQVDFLDERQFAETAAAKARTGAEIVDLTYRQSFVADPEGQWQGYDDVQPQRAWGLSEWGRRAGMGAYLDWVAVNAIVPAQDPDPSHVGIQKIERATVSHLDEIASHYKKIQGQVDEADAGLNPLGLAQNVVPFDIDPTRLNPPFNQTQFEQIYERALAALKNAVAVWDYANELNNQLRRTQDNSDELYEHSIEEETDFVNQLIEIFGYPYADDIGPGGTYPAGYDGPDLYHYMYVDVPLLAGSQFDFDASGGQPFGVNRPEDVGESDFNIARITNIVAQYAPIANGIGYYGATPLESNTPRTGSNGQSCSAQPLSSGCALGNTPTDQQIAVDYTMIESPDFGLWFTKPEGWTTQRRAPGRVQQILQQMLEARVALKQALLEYDRLYRDVFGMMQTVQATFNTSEANLVIANNQRNELRRLTIATQVMKSTAIAARRVGEILATNFKTAAECVPKSLIVGLAAGGDAFGAVRCTVQAAGSIPKTVLDTVADGLDIAGNATEAAQQDVEQLSAINTQINDAALDLYNLQGEIDQKMREEPILRSEIYARVEAINQLVGDYRATLAEGLRVADRLQVFRKDGAEDIQLYRFRDMAFRIFRNDALQKYRAAFDLAARYAYLAASAYDYETNLLGSDSQSGQAFLTDIVRERNLGQILNGVPLTGSPGLADSLAQLKLNFDVLKGRMGFNNPQNETNRFSLRRELFRIPEGAEGDEAWRQKLEASRVPDLWRVPEFRRFARPFAPESAGPQPGLVLEFSTNVTFGLNFFGWDLGPQDSSYDSSQFATRIRSVGTWFADYADLPLADDPRIYLFPVGADVLRSPSGDNFEAREWQVVDQAVPVPFPLGSGDLEDYAWNPSDTLSGSLTEIRRYARIPAFHFSEPFDDSQVTSDSRLVGRSVWNRRWMIIIPGGTFLNDPNEGLDTFIQGKRIPGGGTARDGDGIDDIRIFFKTYAYSGN